MPHVKQFCLGLAALGLLLSGGGAWAEEPKAEPPKEDAAKAEAEAKAAAAKVEAAWVKSFDAAKTRAKLEKKDLLIDFTGSDWCPPCKMMHEEVFSQAEFVDGATKNFVLVYMDFPKGEENSKLVVDPASNERVRVAYGVNSFPTMVLATAEGQPYVRTGGYRPGGPSGFLEMLAGFQSSRATFQAFQAKGKQDPAAFEAGFALLVEGEFLSYPDYAWTLEHAEKQDADGSKGLKKVVEGERARQRSAVEEVALMKIVKETKDPDERLQKVHEFLKTSKDLRGRNLWGASMAVADWLVSKKQDFAGAKQMVQLPLRDPDFAADEGRQAHVKTMLEKIDEMAAAKAEPPAEEKPAEPKPTEPKPEAPKPGPTPK